MAEVDTLRITTAVDLGPLQAGMAGAASAVKESTSQMSADMKKLEVSSSGTSSGISGDAKSIIASLIDTTDAQENASNTQVSANQTIMNAVQSLGGMFGIQTSRITGLVGTLGSSMTGVAATTAVASVGIVAAVAAIGVGVLKLTEYFYGWDEAAKKTYQDNIDELARFDRALQEHQYTMERAWQTAGLSGTAKSIAEQRVLRREIEDVNLRIYEQSERFIEAQKRIAGTEGITNIWGIGQTEMRDKALADAAEAKKEGERLEEEQTRLQLRLDVSRAGLPAAFAKQTREMASAQIDATQKIAMARLETEKQVTENEYRLNAISLDQKIEQEKAQAEKKLQINLNFINAKEAHARKEGTLGTPAGPKIEGLEADRVAAQETYNRQIAAIDTAAAEERKRRKEAENAALLESDKNYHLAIIAGQRAAAKQAYETRRIDAEEEKRQYLGLQEDEYIYRRIDLQKKIEDAESQGEKMQDVATRLHGDLQTLEVEHQNAMNAIRAEGDAKAQADLLAQGEQRLSFALSSSDRELQYSFQVDNDKLAHSQISTARWASNEQAALDRWYADQQAELNRWLALVTRIYGAGSREYEEAINRMTALDQKYEAESRRIGNKRLQEWKRVTNQMGHELFAGLNGWLQGTKSFGQAMIESWDGMVMVIIEQIEKMAAEWIARKVLMAAASKIFGLEEKKTDFSKGVSNAALAGSAAYASVMEALPYPANMMVAPVVAMSAVMEGIAIASIGLAGSFDRGGIADEDMIAKVHKKEMVLPPPISTGLQQMFNRNTSYSNQQSGARVNYAPVFNGPVKKRDLDENRREVVSMVKLAMRRNQLPSYT